MLAVAVEWEIYARTHSATALGLVGLAIAVPVVTLSLPAGHLADRFSRKRHHSCLADLERAYVAGPALWFPGNIFPFPNSRRCVRAIAPWRESRRYSSAITQRFISMTRRFR